MTLSHCWGRWPLLRLLKANHDAFLEAISLEDLSLTFQHAVEITRWSEVAEYIWIDSLCIIQDCATDWAREAATMEMVYLHGYANLAAAHASDGRFGMDARRDASQIGPCLVRVQRRRSFLGARARRDAHDPPDGEYRCVDLGLWQHEVENSPLCKRAWVVQERFLAPIVLYFGQSQIFFACSNLCACESFPTGIPKAMAATNVMSKGLFLLQQRCLTQGEGVDDAAKARLRGLDLLQLWRSLIQEYTRGRLTNASDKLVAIAGMAEHFGRYSGSTYVAGLWKGPNNQGVIEQLLWRTTEPATRPSEVLAPTWSWASIATPVVDPVRTQWGREPTATETHRLLAECILITAQPVTDSACGPQSGLLTLRGALIPAQVTREVVWRGRPAMTLVEMTKCGRPNLLAGIMSYLDTSDLDPAGRFFFAPLLLSTEEGWDPELEGLILRLDGTARGLYHRVGLFSTTDNIKEVLAEMGCEKREGIDATCFEDVVGGQYVFSVQ